MDPVSPALEEVIGFAEKVLSKEYILSREGIERGIMSRLAGKNLSCVTFVKSDRAVSTALVWGSSGLAGRLGRADRRAGRERELR
jgi:hypothetical protein